MQVTQADGSGIGIVRRYWRSIGIVSRFASDMGKPHCVGEGDKQRKAIGQVSRVLFVGALVLCALAMLIASWPLVSQTLGDALQWTQHKLESVSWWVFTLAFCLLPAVGFPLTFFYLTAPGIFGSLWLTIPMAWLCVLINMALSYVCGRYLLHQYVMSVLKARKLSVPEITKQNEAQVIIMCRASPMPWLLQSLLLAIAKARFLPYLLYSMPVQGVIGIIIIIGGKSVLEGNWILAIVAFVVFGVISWGISRWQKSRQAKSD